MQPSSGRAWLLPLSKELHVRRQAPEQHVFPHVQNVSVERKSKARRCWKTLHESLFFFVPLLKNRLKTAGSNDSISAWNMTVNRISHVWAVKPRLQKSIQRVQVRSAPSPQPLEFPTSVTLYVWSASLRLKAGITKWQSATWQTAGTHTHASTSGGFPYF